MSTLLHNARLVTMTDDAGTLESGWVHFEQGTIDRVGTSVDSVPIAQTVIDARGAVVMPAFVDAHTHACWAGERLDEFVMKLQGASYLDILKAGGGILSTVRAVRAATEDELTENLTRRLDTMLTEGTTAVEVKSGYGLTTADELKMLRAIHRAAEGFAGTVVPTACIAHMIDDEQEGFIETTIHETLDAVHAEFPGVAIDAYTEEGAWSLADTVRLFERAAELGHPLRVHTDQFNELGMTAWSIANGVRSVDHLEATSPENLAAVARSGTYGVMLPCSGFQVDGRYADGRAFIDADPGAIARIVLATNCNPGSAPTSSMPFAIALAARHLGLVPDEAIRACTRNAAALLGLTDRGTLAPGQRADIVMLRHTDERQLAYEFGGNPVDAVWCAGMRVS